MRDKSRDTYITAANETVTGISRRFGVSERWLRRINGIDGDTLRKVRRLSSGLRKRLPD
jgi:LysM repeat protein